MPTIDICRYIDGVRTILKTVEVSSRELHIRRLCNYTWYEHAKTHQIYATYMGKRVYLQDVIKGEKGPWIHINGDPNDFRDQNLVKATTNLRTIKRKESTSKTVGVCYVERRNRWKATLANKLIGYFKTESEAAQARLRAVLPLNPMINFVREGTDPDGPSGMQVPRNTEGGRPDVYIDQDDAESMPDLEPVSTGISIIKDRDYWKAIPPPSPTDSFGYG